MLTATRDEIAAYLAKIPNAQAEWVDTLLVAKLPLCAVEEFVRAMCQDRDSPLRAAEDSNLSQEIGRINGVFGDISSRGDGNGRLIVSVAAMLTRGELLRLNDVVGNFCQPKVTSSRRFAHNGHAVAHAARRCATGILFTRVGRGRKVLEVGADVKHWMVDVETREPVGPDGWQYKSARPVLDRRDVVRVTWERFAELKLQDKSGQVNDRVKQRAQLLRNDYDSVFVNKRIEDVTLGCEYIISCDANYDVKFGDMPRVMERTGAKGWFGYMNRVKGLTRTTRLNEGQLNNLGYHYRVDWRKGRIDFRHPQCNAFGYSHDVWELMRYEELNGYVWHTQRASYVYSKGAESNDELLFFSVAKVMKSIYLQQPSYIDNPLAKRVTVSSVWAVGGWTDGVPSEFCPVEFSVDELAFAKVFEKRMQVDVRGDLGQTIGLVKSTNVRMWLNGTPVGVDRRVETQLIEATAVAVEVMAAEARDRGKLTFNQAMGAFKLSIEKQPWVWRLLESVVDLRAVCGNVAGPISRAWASVRGGLVDRALAPLSEFKVMVRQEAMHLKLAPLPERLYGCEEIAGDTECVPVSYDPDKMVMNTNLDGNSSSEDSSTACESVSGESDVTEITEPEAIVKPESDSRIQFRAMDEFMSLERFIRRALHTEVRIDSGRIKAAACRSSEEVLQWSTNRTQHALVRFKAHREVQCMGFKFDSYGAVYDMEKDEFVAVRKKGDVVIAPVQDGWYYVNNHMKVWNLDEILEAVEYAKKYGSFNVSRNDLRVTLGVPGAGKTYDMMKSVAQMYKETGRRFLVLSVTTKARDAAKEEGLRHGLSPAILDAMVCTLDRFLITLKCQVDYLAIDEFPMAHAGRIDAAVAISEAKEVWMYGDGRQIPYDPFTVGHPCDFATFEDVDDKKVVFKDTSHRLSEDACAAWVDVYPGIKSCSCCRAEQKAERTLSWEQVGGLSFVQKEDGVRYHTYTRAEAEDVYGELHMKESREVLKAKKNGGLSTVHEDQGSTHERVHTIRGAADYDKNSSKRNPSLFNRLTYVLTDMTRHQRQYKYTTVSRERDMVIKRVECSSHSWRLEAVRKGIDVGLTSVRDMLTNTYHADILSEVTLNEDYK